MRILTVDDDKIILRYLENLLNSHGEVEAARDGAEALTRFTEALNEGRPYDLVILDIMMPKLNGLEAARIMKEHMEGRGLDPERRSRVVMLSCLTDPKYMLEAQYQSGADAYLTKPVEPAALDETLAALGLIHNPVDEEET